MAVSWHIALLTITSALVVCGTSQWSFAASAVYKMYASASEQPLQVAMFLVLLVLLKQTLVTLDKTQDNQDKLSREFAALREEVKSVHVRDVSFSAVSSSALTTLLSKMGLWLYNGDDSELNVRRRGSAADAAFSWAPYATENAGLPSMCVHIEAQLSRLGVPFGKRGGFDIIDVSKTKTLLSFTVAGVRYNGNADLVIVPHNVARESAAQQARVVFEIKRRGADALSKHFGQATTELIGASVRSAYLCLHVLTDGTDCSLTRLGDGRIVRWRNVSFATALAYAAAFLSTPGCADPSFGVSDLARAEPGVARVLERLRQLTAEPDVLATISEQLDSLADADGDAADGGATRKRLAEELVATWQHQLAALPPEALPRHISHLYM